LLELSYTLNLEAQVTWAVKVTEEYAAWFGAMITNDLASATQVAQAVAALREAPRWADPTRSALLLLGGDKANNWQRWYRDNIPVAERLYLEYTAEEE
jgi:hypothetical protein